MEWGRPLDGADIGIAAFVLSAKSEPVHSKSDTRAAKITTHTLI
jgi:hypothetical protein